MTQGPKKLGLGVVRRSPLHRAPESLRVHRHAPAGEGSAGSLTHVGLSSRRLDSGLWVRNPRTYPLATTVAEFIDTHLSYLIPPFPVDPSNLRVALQSLIRGMPSMRQQPVRFVVKDDVPINGTLMSAVTEAAEALEWAAPLFLLSADKKSLHGFWHPRTIGGDAALVFDLPASAWNQLGQLAGSLTTGRRLSKIRDQAIWIRLRGSDADEMRDYVDPLVDSALGAFRRARFFHVMVTDALGKKLGSSSPNGHGPTESSPAPLMLPLSLSSEELIGHTLHPCPTQLPSLTLGLVIIPPRAISSHKYLDGLPEVSASYPTLREAIAPVTSGQEPCGIWNVLVPHHGVVVQRKRVLASEIFYAYEFVTGVASLGELAEILHNDAESTLPRRLSNMPIVVTLKTDGAHIDRAFQAWCEQLLWLLQQQGYGSVQIRTDAGVVVAATDVLPSDVGMAYAHHFPHPQTDDVVPVMQGSSTVAYRYDDAEGNAVGLRINGNGFRRQEALLQFLRPYFDGIEESGRLPYAVELRFATPRVPERILALFPRLERLLRHSEGPGFLVVTPARVFPFGRVAFLDHLTRQAEGYLTTMTGDTLSEEQARRVGTGLTLGTGMQLTDMAMRVLPGDTEEDMQQRRRELSGYGVPHPSAHRAITMATRLRMQLRHVLVQMSHGYLSPLLVANLANYIAEGLIPALTIPRNSHLFWQAFELAMHGPQDVLAPPLGLLMVASDSTTPLPRVRAADIDHVWRLAASEAHDASEYVSRFVVELAHERDAQGTLQSTYTLSEAARREAMAILHTAYMLDWMESVSDTTVRVILGQMRLRYGPSTD